jgi:hypothetical protein
MAGYPDTLLEDRDSKLDALVVKILADRDNLPPAIVELAQAADDLERKYLNHEQKEAAENDRHRIQLAMNLTDEQFDERFYLTDDFLWETRK